MDDFKLSKDFTFYELTDSKSFPHLVEENRQLAYQKLTKLELLCFNFLQPLRDLVKRPIMVNSGFRSPDLNRSVQGSKYSQHMQAEAVDFYCHDKTVMELYDIISTMEALDWHQLRVYQIRGFVHFGMVTGLRDHQTAFVGG